MIRPRISLIVPNLNEGPYLRNFLRSLTGQRYRNFEVILIDGGSRDNSLEIAEAFQDLLDLSIYINKTRNIGYIRNYGSLQARGQLLFHTSSDVILDPELLFRIRRHFRDPRLISVTGRTRPDGSQLLSHIAYQSFDLLRWAFSKLPGLMRKYRPGGNFLAIRRDVFEHIRGFPEVAINEDGLLGQKIDRFICTELHNGASYKVKFDLELYVSHHVKRFQVKGSLKGILFYLYVIGNMFPFLKSLLDPIERKSSEEFKTRSDLRE